MTIKTKPTATTEPAAPLAKSPSKSAVVLKLLGRAKGATIAEIGEPTGWQPHSTRAYLSGLRKNGRSVIREQRKTGETVYRIVAAANSATAAMPITEAPPASSEGTEAGGGVDGSASVEAAAAADKVGS